MTDAVKPSAKVKRHRMRPDGTLFEAEDGPWVDMTTLGVHHLATLLIDAVIREGLDSVRIHLRMAKEAGQRWGPRLDYVWSQKLMAEEKERRQVLERERQKR